MNKRKIPSNCPLLHSSNKTFVIIYEKKISPTRIHSWAFQHFHSPPSLLVLLFLYKANVKRSRRPKSHRKTMNRKREKRRSERPNNRVPKGPRWLFVLIPFSLNQMVTFVHSLIANDRPHLFLSLMFPFPFFFYYFATSMTVVYTKHYS